jgi:hypothetical protein
MAGEALRDERLAARTRLSNNPETAAERAGLVGDKYDVSGYSDKEISMALQGSSFDENDYARLTGKSDDSSSGGGSNSEITTPSPVDEVKPPSNIDGGGDNVTMPGFPSPNPPGGGLLGGLMQNVAQDNDISSNVTGDNNTVENTQDNSVSQSMGSSAYSDRYARGLKDKYVLNLLNR